MNKDRYFSSDPKQRDLAAQLYARVEKKPLVCPHGHVDPRLFADPNYSFGSPADLLLIPDHYIFRMLYSHGIPMEGLGIPRKDGAPVETDHRKIWQTFAKHFYLFRGTPTGMWVTDELHDLFGITEKLGAANALHIYDAITAQLAKPEFRPRAMFERFNIEVLCTTDAAADPLEHHQKIRQSGWPGTVRPTFRPDAVINLDAPNWHANIESLSQASGIEVKDYLSFIAALENRREHFRTLGATATDHAALTPFTGQLTLREVDEILQRAFKHQASEDDVKRFIGHMLMEMARMSVDDGLVMQLHPGSVRSHNRVMFDHFGPDKGADIPLTTEYTRNLQPLLNKYGNNLRFTLILFTLDETSYSRELAPLAGHYPALKLGPPWWFFDSLNGMARYFDLVMETAGIYNTAGFNDDTRAFPSIPARHDLWRRACATWLGGLVARHIVDMSDAEEMIDAMAYDLVKKAYHL